MNISSQQGRNSLHGHVGILWDIENCPVPSDVCPEDVSGNVRMALRVHPIIKGAVTLFSAYGDFNAFPRRLREGCQRTGVKLVDVPNGRKDAADKAILVDMFVFALDNRPPSSIMLISGDVDFAPALHILGQRGYTVILVIPSGVGVSSALSNAGRFVWDWPSVARGEGFVPPSRTLIPPRVGQAEISGCLTGCHIINDINSTIAIERKGQKKFVYLRNSKPSPSAPPIALAKKCNDTSTGGGFSDELSDEENDERVSTRCETNDASLEQFKYELQEILVSYSCRIFLCHFEAIYEQRYKRSLDYQRFGVNKLEALLDKVRDVAVLHVEPRSKRKILVAVGYDKT